MVLRSFCAASALCGALVLSTAALAAPGVASGNVHMRTGPGTEFSVITTIPAGAPVMVFECESWCQVGFGGTQGYVSANYVSGGYTEPAPRPYYQSRAYFRPEPPAYVEPEPPYDAAQGGFYYPWHIPPSQRWHYRRGDGAYFEFGS